MIETREALAALDAILEVPGLDMVFVGPADLARGFRFVTADSDMGYVTAAPRRPWRPSGKRAADRAQCTIRQDEALGPPGRSA